MRPLRELRSSEGSAIHRHKSDARPVPTEKRAERPVLGTAASNRHVHIDCPSGLAGDMFLAACVDAGVPPEPLHEVPQRLGLHEVEVRFIEDRRAGLRGLRCEVLEGGHLAEDGHGTGQARTSGDGPGRLAADHHHHHSSRGLAEIRQRIEGSGLAPDVRDRAIGMFVRLAEVEAAAHGVPLDQVHFHEVGAVDSLVDIVGAALAWSLLGPATASVSDVVVGRGRVKTQHGVMPVPAPATAALLEGKRFILDGPGELLTPTGALILDTMVPNWSRPEPGLVPPRRLLSSGVGLGRRELQDRCNGCRVSVLATDTEGPVAITPGDLRYETIDVIQTQVDDISPEQVARAMEVLRRQASTLDAFVQPVLMKKQRPGVLITVHSEPGSAHEAVHALARETGTLGCRVEQSRRWTAEREIIGVDTRFGRIGVKLGRLGDEVISVAPEADDVRSAADEHQTAWRRVYDSALSAAVEAVGDDGEFEGGEE